MIRFRPQPSPRWDARRYAFLFFVLLAVVAFVGLNVDAMLSDFGLTAAGLFTLLGYVLGDAVFRELYGWWPGQYRPEELTLVDPADAPLGGWPALPGQGASDDAAGRGGPT